MTSARQSVFWKIGPGQSSKRHNPMLLVGLKAYPSGPHELRIDQIETIYKQHFTVTFQLDGPGIGAEATKNYCTRDRFILLLESSRGGNSHQSETNLRQDP